MNKKSLVNRILVGALVAVVMVGMVAIAAFAVSLPLLRLANIVLISLLVCLSVFEMRRALGNERIPRDFSRILWIFGVFSGPVFVFFGQFGTLLLALFAICLAALRAVLTNRAEALLYVAFAIIYPGLFMSSLFFLTTVNAATPVDPSSELATFLTIDPVRSILGYEKVILPCGAIAFALTFAVSSFTDVFAYFVGSLLGKCKLCPSVSPKKTVEGAVGGLVGGVVGAAVVYLLFDGLKVFGNGFSLSVFGFAMWEVVLIYAIVGVFGSFMTQLGDLTASLIKRRCGVKDYSKILGEHGGILDRFDGIVFNAVFISAIFAIIS